MSRKWFWELIMLLVVIGSACSKKDGMEPMTLYKAENVAIARANIEKYVWAQDIVEGWKRSVEYAMQQDRQFFEDMISEMNMWPTYGQNCPHCVGKLSSMGETGIYEWSIEDPDKLKCKHCGTVYPNPDYPETGSMTAPKMGQTFHFYLTEEERAHPEDTTGKYALRWASWPVHTSFSGLIRTYKAQWCISKILPLAKLYAVTGDAAYAERAAWIMDIMAQRYPNWMFYSYNGTYADCPPAEAAKSLGEYPRAGRFPVETIITAFKDLHTKGDYAVLNNGFWGAGRFGCSGGDGGIILQVTAAYDLIRNARLPNGKPVLTPEMEDRIIDDLLIAGCDDMENWDEINNKCGPGRALSGAVGILFDRPASVRRALEGFETLMDHSFHFDGFCKETPSYSAMHLNLMQEIPEILMGYSDPPGYKPEKGEPLQNFNPFVSVDRYRLAQESMVRMLDPLNRYPVIGDTHYGGGLNAEYAEVLTDRYNDSYTELLEEALGAPLSEKGSEYALWHRDPDITIKENPGLPYRTEWFPGWHVGVLRGGPACKHTALYFNGNAHGIHRHYDTLGLIYIAHGKEVATDRGYIWDDPRNAWTKSTLSHNIVTVDGINQNIKDCDSKLELFGKTPGIEIVQASANAYEQCSQYRRTTALIQLPGEKTYAVDLFRVSGGNKHQYCFNSNGNLLTVSDGKSRPAKDNIEWLSNLRESRLKPPFTATWQQEGVKVNLTILNEIDRLLVADAPGWRSDRGEELDAPSIQQILAERTGSKSVNSHYAAVVSPFPDNETSPVRSARLITNDFDSGVIAVEVKLDDRTDYIISSLDDKERTFGSVTMSGRFGFVSLDANGKVMQGYLLGGTGLRCGDTIITTEKAQVPLKLSSTYERTFICDVPVPLEYGVPGTYLLADDTGYEIESVSGNVITVRDYPAIECDEVVV
ncbi:MAG: heparinase II/III family protein, partial [Candidatus Latescibacteria bacterium]|nr:heparinase II/III family protein [Candidatus Latescibacterota bacterium]